MTLKAYKDWNVAVVGAGSMGLCIAEHFATQGHQTTLYDLYDTALARAKEQIANNLKASEQLGSITCDEITDVMGKLTFYNDMQKAVADADIVIEAVPEVVDIKRDTFKLMYQYAPKTAYLCSNTSGMDIYKELEVKDTDRTIITHFFNPAHLMPLVEIVKGENTPDETAVAMKEFMESTGKVPVILNKIVQGFVFNRIYMALEVEALHLVEEGIVSYEDIDKIITSTMGPRFIFEGIFNLVDHSGLDTEALVLKDLIPKLWKGNDVPCSIQDIVDRGDYGLKTGKGFYDYTGQDENELRRNRVINIMQALDFQKKIL